VVEKITPSVFSIKGSFDYFSTEIPLGLLPSGINQSICNFIFLFYFLNWIFPKKWLSVANYSLVESKAASKQRFLKARWIVHNWCLL
jgi:hypothetical protein